MSKPVDVEIMGRKFTLRSDQDEVYVKAVVNYVNGKMQEVLKSTSPAAKHNVAMLAALNIADEYHRLKDEYETVVQRLDRLSEKLSANFTEEI